MAVPAAGKVEPMDLRDALRSTGSARVFTDQPVSDDVVAAIVDDARFAPSGGNRQGWRVAVVADRQLRRRLAAEMQPVWDEYIRQGASGITPFSIDAVAVAGSATTPATPAPAPHSPNPLIDGIDSVPVVLAVAVDLARVSTLDSELDRVAIVGGASVYPFCWSILLAARARGLGGVMTTFLSRVEPTVGPLLGLPPNHALAATIFLGHPVHQPTRLSRRPVASFTTIDRFDGAPFSGPTGAPFSGPTG